MTNAVKIPVAKPEASTIVETSPVVVDEVVSSPIITVGIIVAVVVAVGWMIYKKYVKNK
jgi:hypothetical protein|tara:strand:+ start:432 stop:608 length:177 start_codon:yes stop_codon:yes gene_type:complete